ncbi:hypothetical protein M3Y94_00431100 [Aphelenchoides besseyi]|nr:hypothetical protein M3Y94_00431100 [Aphelenchoides besseyi]KAI6229477.1 hypothetical protein M3Y95_00535000 [Aphelenchoides besseyi]
MSIRQQSKNRGVTAQSPMQTKQPPGTPQSRKRACVDEPDEPTVVKNVRFALDENSEYSDDQTNPTVDVEIVHANKSPGGSFTHPTNFTKVSPKKINANEVVNTITRCSPLDSVGNRMALRTPSPLILTPRRSAMKRRLVDESGQRPLMDHISTTPRSIRASRTPLTLRPLMFDDDSEESLYPSLRHSTQPINQLCITLAEPTRTRNLAAYFKQMDVTTIGQFASLSSSRIEQIPHLRRPKVDNALSFLRSVSRTIGSDSIAPVVNDSSAEQASILNVNSEKETTPPNEPRSTEDDEIVSLETDQGDVTPDQSRNSPVDRPITLETIAAIKTSPPGIVQENVQPNGDTTLTRAQPSTTSPQIIANPSSLTDLVQFAQELQERAVGLTNLINSTIAAKSQSKYNPIASLRDLHSKFTETTMTTEDCDEMLDLLVDLAKDVNQRRRLLTKK